VSAERGARAQPGPGVMGADAYAQQVRDALGDLPPAAVHELLEDLDEHLAEVAADSGTTDLQAVLGPPAAYAAELRAAAELPGDRGAAPAARRLVHAVQGRLERVRRHEAVRAVLAFLPELRPAWWVARAWLALLAVDLLFGSGSFGFPLPTALGLGALLGLPLVAAAVVLSVQLGRRAQRRTHPAPRQRLATGAGNAVLALLAIVAVVAVQQRSQSPGFADGSGYGYETGYAPSIGGPLAHEDGTPITNIYPYSAGGEPLTGVLLYDQDGRALDNLSPTTSEGLAVERSVAPGAAPPPAHAYPQQQVVERYDDQGNLVPVPQGPTTTPLPQPTGAEPTVTPPSTTQPTATPTSGTRPTATPTSGAAASPSPDAAASPGPDAAASPGPDAAATPGPAASPR